VGLLATLGSLLLPLSLGDAGLSSPLVVLRFFFGFLL
jgi:hypothetical protein